MKRYPPVILATCVIPWNERYEFMEDMFRRQVRTLHANLTKHLYIFGTAGEGYAVSNSQFEAIARAFRDETNKPDSYGMVGVISLSLPTIIGRIELGRDLGFRRFQISLPSWGALTDREVDTFFQETCGRFPDCQFLNYNLMRTKRVLTGREYGRLAAMHPNLVAVKTGSSEPEILEDFFTHAPGIQFFVGEFAYALMRDRHECGLLISVAATNPASAHEFFGARGERLRTLGEELRAVNDALARHVGDAAHMDGAFDKMLYKLFDPEFPLRLLPPYQSTTDVMFDNYRKSMPKRWLP